MGNSPSSLQKSSPGGPGVGHLKPQPRSSWVQHIPSGDGLIPKKLPHWNLREPQRVVTGTWRRSPAPLSTQSSVGPDLSSAWDTYVKRWLWNVHNPGRTCSPVKVKIAPPEHRASPLPSPSHTSYLAQRPQERHPDPCAKETVLRALSQCKKGSRRFDGPLWFEIQEVKSNRQTPETGRSAFKPRIKNGVAASFVPRPGPLNRGTCCWSLSDGEEGTAPEPHVQSAGTKPVRHPEPPLESLEKMQFPCDLCLPPVPKNRARRVSFTVGTPSDF